MSNTNIYSDAFYQAREIAVRQQIGKQLNDMKDNISQLHSPCLVRMMKIHQEMTLEDLLSVDSSTRQEILAAILYNDAFWRMESAYLMLALGMLNVVYSNLRSCLESVIKAHVVENLDSEAIKFVKTGTINPAKISNFIPKNYADAILKMKEAFSDWGVHSNLTAVHLSALFGPNAFEMMVSKTNTQLAQVLNESFAEAAKTCFEAMGQVFLIFMWIISKGTTYHRSTN